MLLLLLALAAGTIQPASAPCEGFEIHNRTGCTAAGDYASRKEPSKEACCSACASQSKCQAWSFHAGAAECLLATNPKLATNPSTADTTCGCRHPGCSPQPQPAATCEPVLRPPKPTRIPLPAGKTQPHIVTILVGTIIRSLVVGSRRSLNEAGAVRVR